MNRKQVLQVEIAHMRYPLRLANAADVRTLPLSQAAALWRGHRRFMGLHPGQFGKIPGIAMPVSDRAREEHLAELQAMQDIARQLVEHVSAGHRPRATFEGRTTYDGGEFTFEGFTVEAFQIAVAWLLDGEKIRQRVRKCPECGRVFFRVRRQIYCRDVCTDRATWRNYPDHKKLRARRRQYARYGWVVGARAKKTKGSRHGKPTRKR